MTPRSADLSGSARVIEGDTIVISDQDSRLYGIDAPETQQLCQRQGQYWPCGVVATQSLSRKIAGREVTCQPRGHDRYWRVLAICFLDEEDLNAWMVLEGWAVAFARYSTEYVPEENAAREARRGLWVGESQMPWEYRRRQ